MSARVKSFPWSVFALLNAFCILALELRFLGYLSQVQWQLVVYVGFILNGAIAGYALSVFGQMRWLGYLGVSLLCVVMAIVPTPLTALWMFARKAAE